MLKLTYAAKSNFKICPGAADPLLKREGKGLEEIGERSGAGGLGEQGRGGLGEKGMRTRGGEKVRFAS